MDNLDDLKEVLSAFAKDEPGQANLHRALPDEGDASPTGASVSVGYDNDGRRFLEIRGLQGELPANIRIEDDQVLGSSAERPDDWQVLDDPDDAEGLRAFSLLDPRALAEQIADATFEPGQNNETLVTAHLNLASFPGLPGELVKWLEDDTLDRDIRMRFQDDKLLEISQEDFFPRRSHLIVERFAQ